MGLSEHTFPATGKPGTVAMLIAPGTFEEYEWMAKHSKTFKNEVCARLMLESHGPNLVASAKNVKCPVLLFICEKDNNVAPGSHRTITEILGDFVNVITLPIGHFDIYKGEHFERAIEEQIQFVHETIQSI